MSLAKKLLATAVEQSLEPIAGAVDFDGVNDYLSRSSDLVGNADGKTFTFSAWVYLKDDVTHTIYRSDTNETIDFTIKYIPAYGLQISSYNDGSYSLLFRSGAGTVPLNTYTHLLVSLNLTSVSTRHCYINDAPSAGTYAYYDANRNIEIKGTKHEVAFTTGQASNDHWYGRLAHVFLDYTYRDLSIEANRRLFITADRKPATGLETLNPILYLPLTDPTQPGNNLGTGGDFALTGVVARSGRGPNQFNSPYSDLDGAADWLNRGGMVGAVNGKAFTFSCCFNADSGTYPFAIYQSNSVVRILVGVNSIGRVSIQANGADEVVKLAANSASGVVVSGRNYHMVMTVDLAAPGSLALYLNGVKVVFNPTTFVNDSIGFVANNVAVGAVASSAYFNGRLGNVFFDTRYIDLSQPDNLAKFVTGTGIDAKPVDLGANGEKPFGTPPLIYLPMYGNNAGKNYGTGGDFTVNSGPFPGARGPNEYWGNKADFNGTTGYLSRASALSGVSDGKVVCGHFFITPDTVAVVNYIFSIQSEQNKRFSVHITNTGVLTLSGQNAAGTTILAATVSGLSAQAYSIGFYIDLSNPSNRGVFINGTAAAVTWTTYTNDSLELSQARMQIGANWNGSVHSSFLDGKLSEFYFTTDYIDFSQEANRLKFRDAFGNPVALLPQIEAGEIPNPAIYMRFDPANFGKNHGTGGDFTVNGTITDGGQL